MINFFGTRVMIFFQSSNSKRDATAMVCNTKKKNYAFEKLHCDYLLINIRFTRTISFLSTQYLVALSLNSSLGQHANPEMRSIIYHISTLRTFQTFPADSRKIAATDFQTIDYEISRLAPYGKMENLGVLPFSIFVFLLVKLVHVSDLRPREPLVCFGSCQVCHVLSSSYGFLQLPTFLRGARIHPHWATYNRE